jgi:hypothetical protein
MTNTVSSPRGVLMILLLIAMAYAARKRGAKFGVADA